MSSDSTKTLIEQLAGYDSALFGQDILETWARSESELKAVMTSAHILEELWRDNVSARAFKGGLAVSIFRDNSTRTRFSYASAASLLGLSGMDLDETKSQIAHGETVRETANMISFLTEAIGIRDDMFIGQGHEYMEQFGQAIDEGFAQGVLPQRPTLVNLQSDRDHPTQSLSDLMHLRETFGSFEALKGKKIVMSWAYSPSYGKPLSVAQGITNLMTRFGMDVTLAHPKGYELMPGMTDIATRQAKASGGNFKVVNDMDAAIEGADIVYPKSWAPFAVMQERSQLLSAGDREGLKGLEQRCLAENAEYKNWEYDAKKMAKTQGGDALYMHCLPADISGVSCAAGEVTGEVFDRYRLRTYKEASHKPYVIAAMILNGRFKNPAELLSQLLTANKKRRKA